MAVNIGFGSINYFGCTGNPTSVGSRWRRWKRSFQFFIEAKRITNDTQKQALLLHCAGQGVQDIFVTLSDPGPAPDGETGGAKVQVTGHRPQVRSQVTGRMPKNVVSFTKHYIRTVHMLTSNLLLHLLGQPWDEFWLPSKGYFQISYCPIFSIVGSFSFWLDLVRLYIMMSL